MKGYNEAYILMAEIYANFSRVDKLWFLGEKPELMHLSLGMHLRNHAKLWENPWEPEPVDGVDYSPNHPDAISSKVIRDFQEVARKEEADKRMESEENE